MIFFATCGRGMESFAIKELEEFGIVCNARIISEGKLIFCVRCDNEGSKKENYSIIQQEQKFIGTCNACMCNFKNIYSINLKDYSYKEFDEISLLNLKLVEKVFYLVYFKTLSCPKDAEICSDNAAEDLINLNYLSVMERILHFKKLRKESVWTRCSNPDQCFAFLSRQDEKEKNYRNRPPKRKKLDQNELDIGSNKQMKINKNPDSDFMSKTEFDRNSEHETSVQNTELKTECVLKTDHKAEYVPQTESAQYTFRVSCRIRGKWKKHYKPFTLSKSLTDSILEANSTWIGANSTPDLDIYVNMNDDCVIVGVPLTDKPLSLRPYIPHIALRSTICHLMVREANIKRGYVILDPMCGVGTILLEAATSITNLKVIGSDISMKTLNAAKCNLRAVQRKDLILNDCSNLPLLDNSIDAILCDFPFGKKHLVQSYKTIMMKMLTQSVRVLRKSSRLVMLVSSSQYSYIKEILPNGINLLGSYPVSLGLTSAYVMTFEKTA